jgi:hypothetical protein
MKEKQLSADGALRPSSLLPVSSGFASAVLYGERGTRMKKASKLALLAIVLLPGFSWAGEPRVTAVPTLGEAGLITLGVTLIGAGVVAIRRKKR